VKNLPPSFACKECETIATDLQNAWKSDLEDLRARLEGVAISSGRDPQKMGLHWIFSIAEMPDDELQALLRSHYPRVAETRRKKKEHEGTTGHSVFEWPLGLNPYKGFIGSK
jgi:hypothetical protein